jgi:hypothetical protein
MALPKIPARAIAKPLPPLTADFPPQTSHGLLAADVQMLLDYAQMNLLTGDHRDKERLLRELANINRIMHFRFDKSCDHPALRLVCSLTFNSLSPILEAWRESARWRCAVVFNREYQKRARRRGLVPVRAILQELAERAAVREQVRNCDRRKLPEQLELFADDLPTVASFDSPK